MSTTPSNVSLQAINAFYTVANALAAPPAFGRADQRRVHRKPLKRGEAASGPESAAASN